MRLDEVTTAELEELTLAAIRRLGIATNPDTERAVADAIDLSPADREERLDSGAMTRLGYRIAWRRTSLQTQGLVVNVARGKWRAVDPGESPEPAVEPTSPQRPVLANAPQDSPPLFPWHRLSVRELLLAERQNVRELQRRKIIRGRGAVVGDLGEWLVATAYDGVLAPPVQRAHDVVLTDGTRIQVKAKVLSDPPRPGQVDLGAIHDDRYDALVGILFDDDLAVRDALEVTPALVERHGQRVAAGTVLRLNDAVIDRLLADGAIRITDRLLRAAEALDDPPGVTPPDTPEDEATLDATDL